MAKFSLQVESDHAGVQQGAQALDQYATSADKAGTSADNFNKKAAGTGSKTPIKKIADDAKAGGAELTGFAKKLDQLGVSTGYASTGLTNAGNQLSDFVVQIVSGQSAFTALVQQGPQLATSFGSFSNTLKVATLLLNPFVIGLTALAVTAGAAGYAIYKEHARYVEFNDALKQTGYQSGLTVKQLQDLSQQLQDTGKYSREAADSAVQMAVSQGGSYAEIAKNADLAAKAQKVLGDNAQDTAKWLKAAYKDPVESLTEMSDKLGGVTMEQYDHIKALQDAGKTQEAAAEVAAIYKTRLDEIAGASKNVEAQETTTWGNIKRLIGEATTLAQNYAKSVDEADKKSAAAIQESIKQGQEKGQKVGQSLYGIDPGLVDANVQQIKASIGELNAVQKANSDAYVEQQAKQKAAENDRIQATVAAQKTEEQYYTTRQKLAAELDDITAKRTAAEKIGATEAVKSYDSVIANIKESIKKQDELDAKRNKPKAVKQEAGAAAAVSSENAATTLLLDKQAQLADARAGNAKRIQEEAAALHNKNLISAMEDAQAKGLLNTQQKNQLAALKANQATLDQVATIGRQIELQKEINRLSEKHGQVMSSEADQMATLGMSTKEANRYLEEQAQIRQRMADNPLVSQASITAQVQAESDAKAATDAAKAQDWMGGLKTGLKDWADSASDYSTIAKDAITSAMDAGVEAVANFVVKGTGSFKDFTTSVLSMIAEIIVKLTLMQAVKAGASALGFAFADGGVMSGGDLSQYSGQIITKPTMFSFKNLHAFANGAGLMGEAGAEAVMPLKRGADGKLGVSAEGLNGVGGSPQISIYVEVNGSTANTSSASDGSKLGKAWEDTARDIANQTIETALAPGGRIFLAQQAG